MSFYLIDNQIGQASIIHTVDEVIHAFNRRGLGFEGDRRCISELYNGEYFKNGSYTVVRYGENTSNGDKMYNSCMYIVVDNQNGKILHVGISGLIIADPNLDTDEIKNALRRMEDGEMVRISHFTIICGKGGVSIEDLKKRSF